MQDHWCKVPDFTCLSSKFRCAILSKEYCQLVHVSILKLGPVHLVILLYHPPKDIEVLLGWIWKNAACQECQHRSIGVLVHSEVFAMHEVQMYCQRGTVTKLEQWARAAAGPSLPSRQCPQLIPPIGFRWEVTPTVCAWQRTAAKTARPRRIEVW